MNSYVLKSQKNTFTSSYNEYISSHKKVYLKLSEIEDILSSCNDTLLITYIMDANARILRELGVLDSKVNVAYNNVINDVDRLITKLEREEEEEREKNT